jgi:hypothetical protein
MDVKSHDVVVNASKRNSKRKGGRRKFETMAERYKKKQLHEEIAPSIIITVPLLVLASDAVLQDCYTILGLPSPEHGHRRPSPEHPVAS